MPSGSSGAKRRARGEGTWQKLPSGLWRLVVRQNGQAVAGPARKTQQEARQALAAKLKRLVRDASADKSPSFGRFARLWLERRRKRLSPSTADVYGYWIGSLEKDPLGSIPPADVAPKDLEAWAARQTGTPTTVAKRAGFLKSILRDAGNAVEWSPKGKNAHERRPLSPHERDALKKAMEGMEPKLRLAALLCWEMGLRRSEACGLMHEDRSGDGVMVRRVVVTTSGGLVVKGKGKSDKALSWVPLTPTLLSLIGQGQGFVLGRGDVPYNPKTLTDRFRKLKAKHPVLAKVPRFGPHALRRTYGMMLLESGADVVTAAQAMRHDPVMLLKEYSRSRQDLMASAALKAFGEHPKATRRRKGT